MKKRKCVPIKKRAHTKRKNDIVKLKAPVIQCTSRETCGSNWLRCFCGDKNSFHKKNTKSASSSNIGLSRRSYRCYCYVWTSVLPNNHSVCAAITKEVTPSCLVSRRNCAHTRLARPTDQPGTDRVGECSTGLGSKERTREAKRTTKREQKKKEGRKNVLLQGKC